MFKLAVLFICPAAMIGFLIAGNIIIKQKLSDVDTKKLVTFLKAYIVAISFGIFAAFPFFLELFGGIIGMPTLPKVSIYIAFLASSALIVTMLGLMIFYRAVMTLKLFLINSSIVVAALIIFIATVLQISFTSDKTSGTLYTFQVLKSQVKDMSCESDYLLIRYTDEQKDTIKYRCPIGVLSFRPISGYLFAAWPNYHEGTSRELALAIKEWERQASEIDAAVPENN